MKLDQFFSPLDEAGEKYECFALETILVGWLYNIQWNKLHYSIVTLQSLAATSGSGFDELKMMRMKLKANL